MITSLFNALYRVVLLLLLLNIYIEISDLEETQAFILIASIVIGAASGLSNIGNAK